MKKSKLKIAGRAVLTAVFILTAFSCATESGGANGTVSAENNDILYLNLLWHQHQPMYYKEPDTGVYSRPWARVHGTKDYLDMAEMLEAYPKLKVTFNLTPVLLRQLTDLSSGAKDIYWTLAEKPAALLSDDEKTFIVSRFFNANYTNMIGRFPVTVNC